MGELYRIENKGGCRMVEISYLVHVWCKECIRGRVSQWKQKRRNIIERECVCVCVCVLFVSVGVEEGM